MEHEEEKDQITRILNEIAIGDVEKLGFAIGKLKIQKLKMGIGERWIVVLGPYDNRVSKLR